VALVIGNSAYRAVGLLPNPTKDAELDRPGSKSRSPMISTERA
jgi:hypothetical protein